MEMKTLVNDMMRMKVRKYNGKSLNGCIIFKYFLPPIKIPFFFFSPPSASLRGVAG